MTTEPLRIPLARLVADDAYQPRVSGLDRKHLALLAESDPDDWPPLLVTPLGNDQYAPIDGWHRYADAQRRQLADLPCQIVEGAGLPEAFAANLKHGLPLSLADRRDYARWLHDAHPDWSLRQLGRTCGLSHNTVAAALRDGSGQADQAVGAVEPANYVRHLVRLLVRADENGEGRILGIFGNRRAQHVAAVLATYPDDERPRVANLLHAWGTACVETASPYLPERASREG
jgi:hypothetical protein